MHVNFQCELIRLEQEDNALHAFVEVAAPTGGPAWEHVDTLHPGGYFPDLASWRVVCTRELRDVGGLEQVLWLGRRMRNVLCQYKMEYNFARRRYEVSSSARSQAVSSKGELKGIEVSVKRRLQKFASMGVNDWQTILRKDCGSDDDVAENADVFDAGGSQAGWLMHRLLR